MRIVVVVTALAACLVPLLAPAAQAQQVQVSAANRTIAITTTETAERRADTATLHIGFQLYAPDSASVYAQAAQISQAIAQALEQAGVPKDAISSENQSTGPNQNVPERATPAERTAHAFQAEQSWSVKTTPDQVAAVLGAAVQAGANQSGSIEWSLSDESSLETEAASKALNHAKAIASQMAQNLGATVSKLLYASNQVDEIRPLARVYSRAAPVVKAAPPRRTLNLNAPLVAHSATVSAIFAIE